MLWRLLMPITNTGWLVLDNGESMDVTLSRPTVTPLMKHWDDNRRRSYLCTGQTCLMCSSGIPQRQRWTCTLFAAGRAIRWEFGADVSIGLQGLPLVEMLAVTVAKIGTGRMARTTISLSNEVDKYITGKYGHMVR
jgi:hypothetical protein